VAFSSHQLATGQILISLLGGEGELHIIISRFRSKDSSIRLVKKDSITFIFLSILPDLAYKKMRLYRLFMYLLFIFITSQKICTLRIRRTDYGYTSNEEIFSLSGPNKKIFKPPHSFFSLGWICLKTSSRYCSYAHSFIPTIHLIITTRTECFEGWKKRRKKCDLLPKNHEGGMKGLDQSPGQGHSPIGQGSRSSCKYFKV
jgi:hypothetical protein